MTHTSDQQQAFLEEAVIAAFDQFKSEHPDDPPYGFALICSSAAAQIQAAFATEEKLSSYTKRYCLSRDQTVTPELLVFKRSQLRWSSLDNGWLIVNLTIPTLDQFLKDVPDQAIEDLCSATLQSLDQKGYFGQDEARHQITIGVAVEQNPTRFLETAKQLNPAEVIQNLTGN